MIEANYKGKNLTGGLQFQRVRIQDSGAKNVVTGIVENLHLALRIGAHTQAHAHTHRE